VVHAVTATCKATLLNDGVLHFQLTVSKALPLLLLLLLQVAWLNAEVIAAEMLALVQVRCSCC
jgi:hypothetical protein